MRTSDSTDRTIANELWRWYLTGEPTSSGKLMQRKLRLYRKAFGLFHGQPRCSKCNAPFSGLGASIANVMGIRPSSYSPNLCGQCEAMVRKNEGGAEVELSLLFADIRGSTNLAEGAGISEFSALIRRFYQSASEALIQSDALINRLMGDQVIGLFVPGFAGPEHAKKALRAAWEILKVTGHGWEEGPWVPVGVGVHTGQAYVGSVGARDGVNEIAVLGDAANLAARLASEARDGEVMVSEAAWEKAGFELGDIETRALKVKGRNEPATVRVIHFGSNYLSWN